MKAVSISGSIRENVGKKDAKAVRKQGLVPAVLYGGEKQIPILVKELDMNALIYTPEVKYAELDVAGKTYQATIQDPDNFYPSPAAFVYTLPNIVTGEIAIRNKYFGETSFIVLPENDPQIMARDLQNAFLDPMTTSVLGGWLDCTDENHFEAQLYLIYKS